MGRGGGGDDGWLTPAVELPPRDGLRPAAIGQATAFRVAAWITLIGVFVAAGCSLVGLVGANLTPQGGAARDPASVVLAMHAVGPRLALAGVCVLAVRAGSPVALITLAAVAASLQACDAAAAAVQDDATMTVLPVLLGAAQGYAIVLLDLARVRGTEGTS